MEQNDTVCPFCVGEMEPTKIRKENKVIANVFKNSALEAARFVLDFVHDAIKYDTLNQTLIMLSTDILEIAQESKSSPARSIPWRMKQIISTIRSTPYCHFAR